MSLQNKKCVMIIDENLPLGIIANTAAIMGITLGREMPEVVGQNVTDQSGNEHLGIITFPVPVLKGSPETIKTIRRAIRRTCRYSGFGVYRAVLDFFLLSERFIR